MEQTVIFEFSLEEIVQDIKKGGPNMIIIKQEHSIKDGVYYVLVDLDINGTVIDPPNLKLRRGYNLKKVS